jgi:hypothetical protein
MPKIEVGRVSVRIHIALNCSGPLKKTQTFSVSRREFCFSRFVGGFHFSGAAESSDKTREQAEEFARNPIAQQPSGQRIAFVQYAKYPSTAQQENHFRKSLPHNRKIPGYAILFLGVGGIAERLHLDGSVPQNQQTGFLFSDPFIPDRKIVDRRLGRCVLTNPILVRHPRKVHSDKPAQFMLIPMPRIHLYQVKFVRGSVMFKLNFG